MNLREDGGQNADAADITAGTCSLTNASRSAAPARWQIRRRAPGLILLAEGTRTRPSIRTRSSIACGTGTGAPVSHALQLCLVAAGDAAPPLHSIPEQR